MRTLSMITRFASRTPWYVLKNITKNTSVTASATFDQIPRPNHSRKSGASTTRGTAFSILMYGSKTRATSGDRANPKPNEIPSAPPTMSPRSDSSSVVARCAHRMPDETHVDSRLKISEGRLTKNGSRTPSVTSACHMATIPTPTTSCHARTVALRAALAPDDFIAKNGPQQAIQIDERRRRSELEQIARPLERHRMTSDNMAR